MKQLQEVERTETVVGVGLREIFVTGAGEGRPVVLLYGGGPGATGASNYSRPGTFAW